METEKNHARDNAIGWAETIAELVVAMECDYDRLNELQGMADDGDTIMDQDEADELAQLTADATIDGELYTDGDKARENARERIQEGPLSVEVRTGWYSPGAGDMCDGTKPAEFRILLSTGGPALQIRGELDEYMQPDRAWLEYQDWGTPWTQLINGPIENSTLLTYCQQFYFGE